MTDFVVPRSVRSPVALAVTVWPSAGTEPSSMGWVRVKVDVGNVEVSMIRPWNWRSRLPESLVTVVMSTVKSSGLDRRAGEGEGTGDGVGAPDGLGGLAEQDLLHPVAQLRGPTLPPRCRRCPDDGAGGRVGGAGAAGGPVVSPSGRRRCRRGRGGGGASRSPKAELGRRIVLDEVDVDPRATDDQDHRPRRSRRRSTAAALLPRRHRISSVGPPTDHRRAPCGRLSAEPERSL